MRSVLYFLTLSYPLLTLACLWSGGWYLLVMPIITFVFIPLLEFFWEGTTFNFDEPSQKSRQQEKIFDWVIYLIVPIQLSVVGTLIGLTSTGVYSSLEIIPAVLTTGLSCGAYGINVAHELGHRKDKLSQFLSKVLLLTALYLHFFIEHNRGHHAAVATENDPASSWKGQNLYEFWFRSVSLGYVNAWKLENKRLSRRHKIPWLTIKNQMTRFQLIQLFTLIVIAWNFGLVAMIAFIGAAIIGFLLLETVNYVEHYGLRRDLKTDARYEKVKPWHSWNSNHPIGRVLLLELTRHSDHHAHPGRKYPTLRYFVESPQLPTGYSGMIVLSLIPSLWFKIMDPHLEQELQRIKDSRLAAS